MIAASTLFVVTEIMFTAPWHPHPFIHASCFLPTCMTRCLTAGRVRYLLVSPNTSLAALLGYTRFRRDELCLYKPRFRQVIGILARSTGIEPVPPRS